MKVLRFLTNLAQSMTVAIIATDEPCRRAYLTWRKKYAPGKVLLEDCLDPRQIEKYFRLAVADTLVRQLETDLRNTHGFHVLEQPARMYFEVAEDEPYGVSSHVIGEMQKRATPRLAAMLHECPPEDLEQELAAHLASVICAAFLDVVRRIIESRSSNTDRVTKDLFA